MIEPVTGREPGLLFCCMSRKVFSQNKTSGHGAGKNFDTFTQSGEQNCLDKDGGLRKGGCKLTVKGGGIICSHAVKGIYLL